MATEQHGDPREEALREQLWGLAPHVLETYRAAMVDGERFQDRLGAADAVAARLLPVRTAEERSVNVRVTVSREERRAIETVCREVGVELPALSEPDA